MTDHRAPVALSWGIREGFRAYLAALADTRYELDGAEADPTGFVFPAGRGAGFRGTVRIIAHAGELDVTLADPAVEQEAHTVVLTGEIGRGRIAIARLLDIRDAADLARHGGEAVDVALTLEGSTWLGGVYAPWARMDPVRLLADHTTRRGAHPR